MLHDRLLYDFGRLPSDVLTGGALTNATELIWNDGVRDVLRLCGASERTVGNGASDYEKFRALCEAYPMLTGHPLQNQIASVLSACLKINTLLSPQSCDAIWQTAAQMLLDVPTTPMDIIRNMHQGAAIRWLCEDNCLPEALPQDVEPVLYGNRLWMTTQVSRIAWEDDMRTSLDAFCNAGCRLVFVRLDEDYTDRSPDVYHVEEALKVRKKSRADMDLLCAQAVRFLASECLSRKLSIILAADCGGRDAEALLERVENEIGLPALCWTASRAETRDKLLRFHAKPHQNTVDYALELSLYPSETERTLAIESAAARYPLGRLCFLTNLDLRYGTISI